MNIRVFFTNILSPIFRILPISKHKILFLCYYGSQYGCNPKYLSEYIVKTHPEWHVVWAFTEPERHSVKGVRKVRYMSLRYFYELCTSHVVITNYRMLDHFKKREGQKYIQTWHSSLRLKMIEKDVESTLKPNYIAMALNDSKNIDILLSGCQKSTEIFEHCFWYDGEIMPSGTPRNDLFFDANAKGLISAVKNSLGIKEEEKVLLYAPTFRKDEGLQYYNVQYDLLQEKLQQKYGGHWKILVRLHPHLLNHSAELLGQSPVIDVTRYDDIQELLLISDMLLTDYSSLMFDFAPSLRPCLLYTPDLESYQRQDRQLYFQIEELPFPICRTNEEIMHMIDTLNEKDYQQHISSFMQEVGSFEDGQASERVVKRIEQWMKK